MDQHDLETVFRTLIDEWLEKREKNPKSFKSSGVIAYTLAEKISPLLDSIRRCAFSAGVMRAIENPPADGDELARIAEEYSKGEG